MTVQAQASEQNVTLTAAITSQDLVNGGVVTFSVKTAGAVPVGAAVTSGPVVDGTATATYVLPAGTPAQTLVITAAYGGTAAFKPSTGTGSLVIEEAPLPLPTVFSLTPSMSLPLPAGTAITWTAVVTGGVPPYSFRFSVFNGTSWTVGRDWSSSPSWTWTPALPGSYLIQVSVRNAGSASLYDAQLSVGALISGSSDLVVTGVTPSAASVPAGTPVTWTVAATGGTKPYSYQFWMFDGTCWTKARDWSASNTWTWTPAAAGTYSFQVWVSNAGSVATYDAWRSFGPYTTTRPAALTVTTFTPDSVSPVPAGTPIRWTATAAGGIGPYTYQFHVFDGAVWTVAQDWSDSPTWTWVSPGAGTYNFQVWVRNAGSVQDYDAWLGTAPFTVTPAVPLTVTSILPDRASPITAGTPVVWTARATGGTGPYTYKLWVFDGMSFTVEQDWSPSNTLAWIPPAAGSYSVQVWVRNAGSLADYDAWMSSDVVMVSEPTTLSITRLATAPGVPLVAGGPATFTATAGGGTGPYTYQFWVSDGTGSTWTIGQPWSPANTWTFTPPAAGSYLVQVWVRNAGSVADWDAWLAFGPFTVLP